MAKTYSYIQHGGRTGVLSIISSEDGLSEEIMTIWPPHGRDTPEAGRIMRVAAAAVVAELERSESDRTSTALDTLPEAFGGRGRWLS